MKPTLKVIALLFCLQFAIDASAQVSKKDFAGIWEFTQFGTDSLNMGPSARGVLKINTDKTFSVVRYTSNGAVITQSGSFKVSDQKLYVQKLLYQLPQIGSEGVGKDTRISYKFSDDKKLMTVSYSLGEGKFGYEVWRKL